MDVTKELVVQICDFMVCPKKNCNVVYYEKLKMDEKILPTRKKYKKEFHDRDISPERDDPNKDISSKKDDLNKDASDEDVLNGMEMKVGELISSDDEDLDKSNSVSDEKKDVRVLDTSSESEQNYTGLRRGRKNVIYKEEVCKKDVRVLDTSSESEQNYTGLRRRRKNVIYKEEITDDSDSEHSWHESSSSESEPRDSRFGKRKKKVSYNDKDSDYEDSELTKKGKLKKEKTKNLTSFELLRQKNLDDKMEFLKSLKMNEIVDDLEETVTALRKKRKTRTKKEKVIAEISRRSERMEKMDVNLSEEALQAKVYREAEVIWDAMNIKHRQLPSIYSFKDAFCGDEEKLAGYQEYFDLTSNENDLTSNEKPHDLNCFDPQVFTSHKFPFNLSCIVFHPAENKTIMLVGSTVGQISLWNKDTDDYLFAPHTDKVTRIEVKPKFPNQMVSSSYDGSLRLIDLEKKKFTEIFKDNGKWSNAACTFFDFIHPNQLLVAQRNGYVSLLDEREQRYGSRPRMGITSQWKCSKETLCNVRSHPTKKELCLSLDSPGLLKVWDLRNLKNHPLCAAETIHNNQSRAYSASFSPITGNSILYSNDSEIRVYNSSCIERRYLHLHQTFRNVLTKKSCITANWMPGSDDTFIAYNNFSKKLNILNSKDGTDMSNLKIANKAYIAVHPVHNILAVNHTKQKGILLYMK